MQLHIRDDYIDNVDYLTTTRQSHLINSRQIRTVTALTSGHYEIFEQLLNLNQPDINQFLMKVASTRCDIRAMKILVRHGYSLETSIDGMSLLHHAILSNSPNKFDMINYLLDTGLDIDARSEPENTTPLFWALLLGQIECAKLLFARGADSMAIIDGLPIPYLIILNQIHTAIRTYFIAISGNDILNDKDIGLFSEYARSLGYDHLTSCFDKLCM